VNRLSFLLISSVLLIFTLSFAEEESAPLEQSKKDTLKYPNKSLVQAAWDCYNSKNYDAALSYAERCIALYDTYAKKMQASLDSPMPKDKINSYWVLNDVATAKFIKGKILWIRKDIEGARSVLSDVARNYTYAMAYDLRGWYWSIAKAAEDMLRAIELGIDFGDSSSSFLVSKAWESYTKKDYKATLGYAEQCIKMYKEAALWQQKSLTNYPEKKEIKKYWALNDVGTCCFLAGKSCLKLGQKEKAREYFNFVKKNLKYASCWDPKGWYWKVVDAIKRR
jgi:hypothetical protein